MDIHRLPVRVPSPGVAVDLGLHLLWGRGHLPGRSRHSPGQDRHLPPAGPPGHGRALLQAVHGVQHDAVRLRSECGEVSPGAGGRQPSLHWDRLRLDGAGRPGAFLQAGSHQDPPHDHLPLPQCLAHPPGQRGRLGLSDERVPRQDTESLRIRISQWLLVSSLFATHRNVTFVH